MVKNVKKLDIRRRRRDHFLCLWMVILFVVSCFRIQAIPAPRNAEEFSHLPLLPPIRLMAIEWPKDCGSRSSEKKSNENPRGSSISSPFIPSLLLRRGGNVSIEFVSKDLGHSILPPLSVAGPSKVSGLINW